MLERLVFKKLELWLIAIVLLAFCIAAVLFSAVVHITTKGSSRFGQFGEISVEIATIPENTKAAVKFLTGGNNLSAMQTKQQRFEGRTGFAFKYEPGSRSDLGYLLLSRYDGDIARSVAELVDHLAMAASSITTNHR